MNLVHQVYRWFREIPEHLFCQLLPWVLEVLAGLIRLCRLLVPLYPQDQETHVVPFLRPFQVYQGNPALSHHFKKCFCTPLTYYSTYSIPFFCKTLRYTTFTAIFWPVSATRGVKNIVATTYRSAATVRTARIRVSTSITRSVWSCVGLSVWVVPALGLWRVSRAYCTFPGRVVVSFSTHSFLPELVRCLCIGWRPVTASCSGVRSVRVSSVEETRPVRGRRIAKKLLKIYKFLVVVYYSK